MDLVKLALFAPATLVVFYLVGAAIHDIAHGESDLTFEYRALGVCAVAFALLYRAALRLGARERAFWLAGTALLLLPFVAGAVNVVLRGQSKYPADPTIATAVLLLGLPLLCSLTSGLLNTLGWGWPWGHRKRPFDQPRD